MSTLLLKFEEETSARRIYRADSFKRPVANFAYIYKPHVQNGYAHPADALIGTCRDITVREDGLYGEVTIIDGPFAELYNQDLAEISVAGLGWVDKSEEQWVVTDFLLTHINLTPVKHEQA